MSAPIQRQLEIFNAALERPSGPERDAYLAEACAGDHALRQCVEDLLSSHSRSGTFLAQPAGPVGPTGTHLLPITEKPGDKIGRYKLLQQIGEGGCGTVYMAEQEEPVRRRVALKVIRLGMDTKTVVARFEAERQALALMDHPNIARVFDGGTTESGRPYFVMELVRGIKITDYCDQAHLSIEERLKLFIQVCQALQHAHQKGVIHRDIKPSNILVTVNDGVPVPKIIDFGIAKATDQRLTDKSYFTEFHVFIGTPAYTSPEQAEMSSLDVDTRSDIYSLGVLLYEMLTGQTPFPAERLVQSGLDEMRRIIRDEEPLRPSTRLTSLGLVEATELSQKRQVKIPALASTIRGDLDWIVMKALEKDRTRRYATSLDFAADLLRHLDNEAVLARPPSLAYKFHRTVRRNKGLFAAAAAVLFALLTGLGLTAWQAVRATNAEQAQKAQAEQAQADRDRALGAEADSRIQTGVAKDAWATARRKAYAAEVNVAFQALAENNLARAIDLLNRQRPEAGEEDLRSFEWRLLWKQCQADQKVTFRDEGAGGEVLFSPDGKWLVNGGDEIVIRELPSQAKVATIPNTIPSGAKTFAFSPRARLLAVSQDTDVRLWSTESWKEERTLPGTRYPAVFSPDGRWLVTGAPGVAGAPGGYRLWNTETWEAERFFGSELERIWVARRAVTFTPDGTILVTAGHPEGRESGNQFQVWDFPSLTVRSNFARFPGRLASAAFALDGKHLLTGTAEGGLLVWNVAEGRIVESLKEHSSWITTIAVAGDGRTFATASTDRTLVLWDAATRKALIRLRGHLAQIWSIALSPDGRLLASSALDGTTRLWDATARQQQRELPDCFVVAGFSSDSRRLVGIGYGESRLWNLENGASTTIPLQDYKKLQYRGVDYRFIWASRDLHGKEPKAVYGRTDGLVEIWNLANMSRETSRPIDDGDVAAAAFSPDGKFIATSGDSGEIVLWDAGIRREVRRFESLGGKMMGLSFSPDGRLLAGSEVKNMEDSHIGIWDVETGALIRKVPLHGDVVTSLAFSPDGKLLATAAQSEKVQLWDIPSGALRVMLMGHAQTVMSVAFSPDGKTLATGGADGKVKLWNIATEQEVATLELPSMCSSVKFSPDGRILAVGYLHEPKQRIRLWEVPSFEEIAAAEKDRTEISNSQR